MPEPDILTRIALHTGKRVERWKRERPISSLKRESLYGRSPLDLRAALAKPGLNVIAEVKFASPSEGFLREERKGSVELAVQVAGGYLSAGAAALSILTERNFFAGSPDYLSAVRAAHPEAVLLMKDFVVDPYQLELARAIGADAVLLIVALLGTQTRELLAQARALGLSCLVETHTAEELSLARQAGADVIGVNSRDLKTLKTDLDVARRLAGQADGSLLVAESGLKTRADLDELSRLGYGAFLIGTSFMKEEDPGAALRALIGLSSKRA